MASTMLSFLRRAWTALALEQCAWLMMALFKPGALAHFHFLRLPWPKDSLELLCEWPCREAGTDGEIKLTYCIWVGIDIL